MTVDYNLVVLGGTAAARQAAADARYWGARVALVEPAEPVDREGTDRGLTDRAVIDPARTDREGIDCSLTASEMRWWQTLAFGLVTQRIAQARRISGALVPPIAADQTSHRAGSDLLQWTQDTGRIMALAEQTRWTLADLAAIGVDVVVGTAAFASSSQQRRSPRVVVANRTLGAHRYLLALASQPAIPAIPGLAAADYRTADSLWSRPWPTPPQRLVILGGTPTAIELAQAFRRIGSQIILVTQHPHLLPQEEPELMIHLQAVLEAEGIQVWPLTTIQSVRSIASHWQLQIGDTALETDGLLIATGYEQQLRDVHLDRVGVRWHPWGIPVKATLQTSNPHIYACGEVLGGYRLPQVAQCEAALAVRNALFLPIATIDYQRIPWAVASDPEFVRIGLTETQARQRFGRQVIVLRPGFQSVPKAQISHQTTGWCKVVLHSNGEVLGAHVLGSQATEWMSSVALAIQHRLRIDQLAAAIVAPAFAEVLHESVQQWRSHRPSWQRDWRERWFDWQR